MAENKGHNKHGAEWIAFAIYALILITVSCFHEPWHDEAEAWQMAKANLRDVLFYIPHYEGHPSLWYLILAIPARLGVPYEIGLKSIACASALIYGWLLFFRSPFPKVVRCLLPFHYFLLYQYGVLSRPYCLIVICFFLMAMNFKERNVKPWRFVLPMAFLCALSGYGIVLAGAICLVWVWEICKEKEWKLFKPAFWKDQRILSLAVLLVIAVLIMLQISPREDTYATSRVATNSFFTRLVYTLFMMLPDSTVITVLEGAAYLDRATILLPVMVVGVLVGACMLCAITLVASKKNLAFYFVPYVIFGIFSASVYFCAHHMGMILVFTIFWLWIAWEDPEKLWLFDKLKAKIKVAESDAKTLRFAGKAALAILIAIPIYWTVGASFLDVTKPFYYSRDMAKFMRETGLDQLKVMGSFSVTLPEDYEEGQDLMPCVNTELVSRPISVLAYYDHNFCLNVNMGRDDAAYALHRNPSAEENRRVIEEWRKMGQPDVLIDGMELEIVFGEEARDWEYVPVYAYKPFMNIWKAFTSKYNIDVTGYIYVRKEIAQQYGLQEVQRY